jgi:hypothetical protein
MDINELAKIDNLIMEVIKVKELNRIVAKTDKGNLTMKIEKGETDYKFFLDSIPLNKEKNANLLDLFDGVLYEIPKPEEEDFIPAGPIFVSKEVSQETIVELPQQIETTLAVPTLDTTKDQVNGESQTN